MTELFKEALRIPVRKYRAYRAKTPVARLAAHESPLLKAIGVALRESLDNALSRSENELLALIERRRSSLLGSDKEISVTDYGAGSPSSNRTREEMERGVKSTALVSSVAKASKPAFWATFLFKLIRKIKPLSCLELGSCVGISASYQAAALVLNGKGKLITLEGSPEIAKIAQETFDLLNFRSASVVEGPFHLTLKSALECAKPVDFFFNDGHHDHDAAIQYFNESMPFLSDEAVIVIDDVSWSSGMRRAWSEIENDERVAASIDLGAIGIALLGDGSGIKGKWRIPL